jgi:hypothetical protein
MLRLTYRSFMRNGGDVERSFAGAAVLLKFI